VTVKVNGSCVKIEVLGAVRVSIVFVCVVIGFSGALQLPNPMTQTWFPQEAIKTPKIENKIKKDSFLIMGSHYFKDYWFISLLNITFFCRLLKESFLVAASMKHSKKFLS